MRKDLRKNSRKKTREICAVTAGLGGAAKNNKRASFGSSVVPSTTVNNSNSNSNNDHREKTGQHSHKATMSRTVRRKKKVIGVLSSFVFFLSSICFLARTKVSTSTPETSSQCHSNVSNSVVNEWEICPIKICLYNQKVFLLQGSLECSICNYKNGRNGYSLKEKATSMSNDGQKERKESQ